LFSTGDWAAARVALRGGLDELPAGNDDLLVELQMRRVTLGREGMTAAAWGELRGLIDGEERGRTRTERLLLVQLAYEAAASGALPHREVERLARRALADGVLMENSAGDTWPFSAACYAMLYAGEVDAALRELGRAIELSQRQGSPVAFGHLSRVRGTASYTRGNLLEALADLRSALDSYSEEYEHGLPWTLAFLALCLIERDDVPSAERALTLSGDERKWRAQPSFRAYLYALGRLRAAQGRVREGLDRLLESGHEALTMNFQNPVASPWRADAALLCARLGDQERAEELIADDLSIARQFGAPHAVGVALRAAGLIEGGTRGLERLAEAAATLERSGSDLELARTLTDHGAALRRAGRRREAREPLRRGLDLATRCGALAVSRRAREELVAAGARPRRERIAGVAALTASELRVAKLAASGLTNREIAQALFVSMRTVSTHLGHVYSKLDTSDRTQLAALLAAESAQMP
jgi:DNA-binding CsgD family transcriptional regulator